MTIKQIEKTKEREEEKLARKLEKMADALVIPLAIACKKEVPDLQHIIWGMGGFSIRGNVTFTYHEPGFPAKEINEPINGLNFEKNCGYRPFYPQTLIALWEACQALNDLDLSTSKDIILRDIFPA
jgi:hypothetical protein